MAVDPKEAERSPVEVPTPANVPPETLAAEPTPAPNLKLLGGDGTTDLRREFVSEFVKGTLTNVQPDDASRAITLARTADGAYAASGELVSAEYQSPLQFDNLLLSWNGSTAPGTSLTFFARVLTDAGWSPWGKVATWSAERRTSEGGEGISMLGAKGKAVAWQYKADLATSDPTQTPQVRSVSVAVSVGNRPPAGPAVTVAEGWQRELAVPTESQVAQDSAVAPEICSPTSLTMVLRFWGEQITVPQTYRGVRDTRQIENPYGNWPLNTAFAGAQGFDSYVARLYSFDQIKNEIAAGRPVPISIAFKEGELPGAALSKTTGHFVVVRGFTPEGDAIINDPWGKNPDDVRRVVNAAALERVWLGHGGIAYMVAPAK